MFVYSQTLTILPFSLILNHHHNNYDDFFLGKSPLKRGRVFRGTRYLASPAFAEFRPCKKPRLPNLGALRKASVELFIEKRILPSNRHCGLDPQSSTVMDKDLLIIKLRTMTIQVI